MPRQRPAPGAAHLLVDVAVVDAVEDRGRAGGERAADHGRDDQPERRARRAAAKNITGTVVSSSSSITRGLVSPTYAATTSFSAARSTGALAPRAALRVQAGLADVRHGVLERSRAEYGHWDGCESIGRRDE